MKLSGFELKKTYLSKIRYPYSWEISLFTILVIILFSNIHWENFFNIKLHLEASPKEVFLNHKYWKAWTTTLIHSDMTHLLSNISMLLLWGFMSTAYYGPLFYPFISFFINGFLTLIILNFYPANTILLGSSGLVFFLGGHWISLYLFIDKKVSAPKRIFKAFGVALILFIPSSFSPNTSYLSHYVGLFGGFIYGLIHYIFGKNKFKKYEEWIEQFDEEPYPDDFSNETYLYDENDEKQNKKHFYH